MTDEEQPKTITVRKIASTQLISNELLRTPPPPTREERIARHERDVAEWEAFDIAVGALASLHDPVADLHAPDGDVMPQCAGCDYSGYEGEPPEWPCRTTILIAEHYGIPLPDGVLWRRPGR